MLGVDGQTEGEGGKVRAEGTLQTLASGQGRSHHTTNGVEGESDGGGSNKRSG